MSKSVSKRASKATSKSSASQIPTPFSRAPSSLQPFLERLDPSKVYITHIDRHLVDYKKRIFLIPVLLNAAIALFLAWRLYVAVPKYLALFATVLGYLSPATVDLESTTRNEQFWIVARRTGMFIVDFLLFRFVGVWPLSFFFEQPANPVTWRWSLGFQPKEVVVRVSRGWGNADLMKGVKQGEENAFFKTRILPAIAKEFMRKTGYLMMDGSWDLEFELMQDAHTLEKFEKLRIEELDKLVLVQMEGVGWLSWQWETEDVATEDRRQQIVAFKEKLTAMGKESLFWKWTEIVEDERLKDGTFSPEQQRKVAEKIKTVFEREGVDFEEIMKEVGGLEDLPVQ